MTIDLQVNGYLNIDFSSEHLTVETCRYACEQYLKCGGASFLPTMITSSRERYRKNLPILAQVINEFKGSLPGLHLEGPFISPEPGAVGAHNPYWTSAADIDYFKELQEWAGGHIKLLTMAAEIPGAVGFCKTVSFMGVCVSLGHQLAGYSELCQLRDAGARALTHLGNGMPNLVNRHENVLLSGLACEGLTAMIITDGHHLPEHLIDLIIRTKGMEQVVVVSDASPLAGMPAGSYSTLGNDVILEANGRLHNASKKCLVGSSCTLNECVEVLRNLKYSNTEIEMLTSSNAKKLLKL